MTFEEFVKNYNGKAIDFDRSVVGVQCVDLIKNYINKVFGLTPKAVGNAHCYYDNYEKEKYLFDNFERIANTKEFVPLLGDIMVWNVKRGKGAGHVAICTGEGTTKEFYSYDQNWNGKKEMQKVKHNYTCVLGVLRPRNRNKLFAQTNTIHAGDKVKVKFQFADTTSRRINSGMNEALIEYDGVQFWIPTTTISGNVCSISGIVAYAPEGAIKDIIEIDNKTRNQLWISVSDISK